MAEGDELPVLAAVSPPSGDPPVVTLAGQDPEATAMTAHRHRKALMKEKRKNKVPDQGSFLSNLCEVDADVNFRFTFTVVATQAAQIVEAVCSSPSAMRVGGALSSKHGKQELHRCMCEVSGPAGGLPGTEEMAKLAFHARGFDGEPPPCHTRQDALSHAIVYALDISASADGESLFMEQLRMYQAALRRLRSSTQSRLRPVKALLLYSSTADGAVPKSGLEAWALQLADFEQEHGDSWKFGPWPLQDNDTLHQVFAEITSKRLAHTEADQKEEETALAEEPTFTPRLGGEFVSSFGAMNRLVSSASSTVSEQERPPCYGAEMSGSECSESALELHSRTFGLDFQQVLHSTKQPLH